MKRKNTLWSLVLALVMVLGVFAPLGALAAVGTPLQDGAAAKQDTLTVTLHKMLMDKEEIKAQKITITYKKGDEEKSITKVIVKKMEQSQAPGAKPEDKVAVYYDGNTKIEDSAKNTDLGGGKTYNDFITAYDAAADKLAEGVTRTPVFPGHSGVNNDDYIGNEITGLTDYFGTGAKQVAGVYFAWQKEVKGQWKYIDANGEEATIQDPSKDGFDAAVLGSKTGAQGVEFYTNQLPKGEYRIVEIKELSTYKSEKADKEAGDPLARQIAVPVVITLPVVNKDGAVTNVHVYPKNVEEKPQIDKNFRKPKDDGKALKDEKGKDIVEMEAVDLTDEEKNALKYDNNTINLGAKYENYDKAKAKAKAYIGKDIPYEVKTKIDAGTSYERLIWNDTMTNGLTFNVTKYDKNGKVPGTGVTIKAVATEPGKTKGDEITLYSEKEVEALNKGKQEDEKIKADYKLIEDNNGFRLQMTDAGLDKIKAATVPEGENAVQKDVEITLTYSAKVNTKAVHDAPEKNNVTLDYGHKKGKDLVKHPVNPSNGELKVNKSFDPANEDHKDLNIVYTLSNGTINASVALDGTMTNKTFDLGNGITFEVGDTPFNGTFKGEALKSGSWTITERVAGFDPAYAETDAAGTVIISNKKDNDNPPPLKPTTPEVVVGGKKFVKTTEDNKTEKEKFDRLAGAKFIIKDSTGKKTLVRKSVSMIKYKEEAGKVVEDPTSNLEMDRVSFAKRQLDDAVKAYNDAAAANKEQTELNKLKAEVEKTQKAYDKAVKESILVYEWASDTTKNDPIVLTSNKQGQFEIDGLEYGTYKLEEIEAPKDYAKLAGTIDFTVDGNSYTSETKQPVSYVKDGDAKDAYRVINKKVTIPQTGGMGTMIFMVAGLALMGGAFIAMRKRSAEQA